MNHLRPNLKKGAFSKEEENKIINLHRKIGNKRSRMAADISSPCSSLFFPLLSEYISLETVYKSVVL